jgi:predicted secreted Zn-dependent protease
VVATALKYNWDLFFSGIKRHVEMEVSIVKEEVIVTDP